MNVCSVKISRVHDFKQVLLVRASSVYAEETGLLRHSMTSNLREQQCVARFWQRRLLLLAQYPTPYPTPVNLLV